MKGKEMHDLPLEDVQQKHEEWQQEHFRLRMKHALGQLENPLLLRSIRRDIARAKTLLTEHGVTESSRRRRHTTASTGAKVAKGGKSTKGGKSKDDKSAKGGKSAKSDKEKSKS